MKEKIKVIVMDMDGTLLNSEKQVTPYTKDKLIKMKQKGYAIGIASGRPLIGLQRAVSDLQMDELIDFLVAFNGAELFDCRTGETECFYQLEPEVLFEIIDLYEPFELNPYVYQEDVCYAYRNDSTIQRAARNNHLKIEICDMKKVVTTPQSKLVLSTLPEKMESVERFYKEHPSERYRAFKTQADMFEFVHPELSKVYGIRSYCEKYDFSLEEVAAFGDTTNDIEMIQECGYGVCMCNGTQDTKSVADRITEKSNDEDGLALVLEEIMQASVTE